MECNKDEAVKAKRIAEKKLLERDITGAWEFALKAQSLFPKLDGLSQLLVIIHVYAACEKKINGELDYYGILGVVPFADEQVLRKQYMRLTLYLHPDKNNSVEADEAFKIMSQAWSVLSAKDKRNAYDSKLRASKQSGSFPASSSMHKADSNSQSAATNSQSVPTQPQTQGTATKSQSVPARPQTPGTANKPQSVPSQPQTPYTATKPHSVPARPQTPGTATKPQSVPTRPQTPGTTTKPQSVSTRPQTPGTTNKRQGVPTRPQTAGHRSMPASATKTSQHASCNSSTKCLENMLDEVLNMSRDMDTMLRYVCVVIGKMEADLASIGVSCLNRERPVKRRRSISH